MDQGLSDWVRELLEVERFKDERPCYHRHPQELKVAEKRFSVSTGKAVRDEKEEVIPPGWNSRIAGPRGVSAKLGSV